MLPHPHLPATGCSHAPRSHHSLARDTRGGILIFGVVLGLLLILMLAQLLAKGHAVLGWHAHQNAADEAAYTNAAWHAQGMNQLVSVNLLTTAVIGMLVALRVAVVAAGLSIVVQLGAPPSAAATPDSTMLENLEHTLEQGQQITDSALGVLAGLQAAQTAIAAYAPVLAAIQAQQQQGPSIAAHSLSSSLLPTPVVSANAEFAAERLGGDRSLPVQRARDSVSCDKAKARWSDGLQQLPQALRLTRGSPAAASATLQRWGLRPSRAADWLQHVASLMDDDALAGRSAVCGAQFLEALRRAVVRSRSAPPEAVTSEAVTSALQSDADAQALALRLIQGLEGSAGSSAGPALWPGVAVWTFAQNGNLFLRSAAAATWTKRERIAALDASPNEHACMTERWLGHDLALAHADTYFDCAGDWSQCEPVAMWQPRWRARLRRAEPWGVLLASMGLDSGFYASREIGREIQWLVADGTVGTDAQAAEQLWQHLRSGEPQRVQELLDLERADAAENPLRTFLKEQAHESSALY